MNRDLQKAATLNSSRDGIEKHGMANVSDGAQNGFTVTGTTANIARLRSESGVTI